jgi:hypothetical protein
MALTMEGALKIAAGKTGLGIDEYTQKIKKKRIPPPQGICSRTS